VATGRSILLITHYYPPSEMVAARRPAGFAKHLERLGHRVTVLTSSAWGAHDRAGEPASEVVRTRDLMDSGLNWRRKQLRAWTGEAPAAADYAPTVSWPARVIVPDVALMTWLPFVLAAARRLAAERRFDCVMTTSGPESVHLAGLALRRSGLPWIADFRDGWGFESLHDWPTAPQWALDRKLEAAVVRGADAVCAVTEPIAADLSERFDVDAWTITNGYDLDEVPTPNAMPVSAETHVLLHSGRMASSQRSPQPVLDALALLRAEDPAVADRLRLELAGPLTPDERASIEDPTVAGSVRSLGNLPREEVLRRQREAGSLLLLTAGNRRGEATGKLYEYLSAGRPILVLGDRTEAARIVTDAGAGIVVAVDDPRAIAAALRRLVAGEVEPAGAPQQYGYPALAARLAELVEVARERAAQRSSTA
jgi:glycosyltransferase involved in cell wall biosynthesis